MSAGDGVLSALGLSCSLQDDTPICMHDCLVMNGTSKSIIYVCGTRSSMLAGLSCTKGVWYIYDWDTGSSILIR